MGVSQMNSEQQGGEQKNKYERQIVPESFHTKWIYRLEEANLKRLQNLFEHDFTATTAYFTNPSRNGIRDLRAADLYAGSTAEDEQQPYSASISSIAQSNDVDMLSPYLRSPMLMRLRLGAGVP